MPEKIAVDASTRLIENFGLVGILIVAMGLFTWWIISWFQYTAKEQRTDFLAALKGQRDDFTGAMAAQTLSHTAEIEEHHKQAKEWRAEQLIEARAMREMLQQCLNKLALLRLSDPAKKKASPTAVEVDEG